MSAQQPLGDTHDAPPMPTGDAPIKKPRKPRVKYEDLPLRPVGSPPGPFDPETGRKPGSRTSRAIDYYDRVEPPMPYQQVAKKFKLDRVTLYLALKRREVLSEGQCPHCGHIPGTRIRQAVRTTQPRPLP